MRSFLLRHPDSLSLAAASVQAESRATENILILSYTVKGKISDIHLPAIKPPKFGEELWRHTCFEAFVRTDSTSDYYEFNFAPSNEWAVYRFSGYRDGMQVAKEVSAPAIEIHHGPEEFMLRASIDLDGLNALPRHASWRLGVSVVIEDNRGCKSFWAMTHPPGKPDFHHLACCAHELSRASEP